MRRAIAVLALLALATPAWSLTTRYVTVTGAGTADGTSLGNAWTLAQANSAWDGASDDYKIIMAAGTYSTAIQPMTGGLNGKRLTFLPAATTAVDTTVLVSAINLYVPGVTVRGIESTAGVTFFQTALDSVAAHYARSDTVINCTLGGALFMGAKKCVLYGCTVYGGVRITCELGNGGYDLGPTQKPPQGGHRTTDSCTIERCAMYQTETDGTEHRWFSMWSWTQHCVVDSNSFNYVNAWTGAGVAPAMIWICNSRFNYFHDNHWRFQNLNGYEQPTINKEHLPAIMCYVRDSSSANVFLRDTLEEVGFSNSVNGITADFAATGSFGVQQVRDNSMTSCVIKLGVSILFYGAATGWQLNNNIFASRTGSLYFPNGPMDSTVFVHNTIYSSGAMALQQEFGDVLLAHGRFAGNLMLSAAGGVICDGWHSTIKLHPAPFHSDSNVVWSYAGRPEYAVRSLQAGCQSYPAWAVQSQNDAHSFYADPQVPDTSWTSSNFMRPIRCSWMVQAINGQFPDGYAGFYKPSGCRAEESIVGSALMNASAPSSSSRSCGCAP